MDENKIEEMRQVIQNASCKGIECEKCWLKNSPTCVCVKALYNEGYRKESDTAREILECLRFLIEERNCVGGYDLEDETIDGTIFVEILNELKERYGVEVE